MHFAFYNYLQIFHMSNICEMHIIVEFFFQTAVLKQYAKVQ